MLDFGFYNMDCMEAMREMPDKCIDLAICDPPYGGANKNVEEVFNGAISGRFGGIFEKYIKSDRTGGTWASKYGIKINNWDIAPTKEYFEELFRVSKNQIIWGGNYFELPPTRCFVVWRKLTISDSFSMAMAEYAWTSFNENAKVFECAPQDPSGNRFHPTQKPVKLYEWLLNKYAKPGDIILDTHVGSASSLIACRNTNHKYVGFEIDPEYYRLAKKRLDAEMAQMNLFDFMNPPVDDEIQGQMNIKDFLKDGD